MKRLLKITLVLLLLGGAGTWLVGYAAARWAASNQPKYRQVALVRGDLISVINATGTIEPIRKVTIGSVVSGPIKELLVDFNSRVTEGQLLAKIDPRIYDANLLSAQAALANQEATVKRAEAQLQQAINDEKRAQAFRAENAEYLSDAEMDQYIFNRKALEAALDVAKAGVKQAQANVNNAVANVAYTEIKSPVDGVVIDRKIDQGQTVAASFQTPEMFIVAPKMDELMLVKAQVDEADIGLVRQGQEKKHKVEFTVNAYPDDLFTGEITQIRMNSTTTSNVVTYTVVIEAPNPEMKLLPGMTASLSFQVDERRNVLKIPNAALRFLPTVDQAREEDRKLLETQEAENSEETREQNATGAKPSGARVAANRARYQRHLWVVDGERLRAVPVTIGLNDYQYTELVSGDLPEDQKVVTRLETPK